MDEYYNYLTNIYNLIDPHAEALYSICKWLFIVLCAFITIRKCFCKNKFNFPIFLLNIIEEKYNIKKERLLKIIKLSSMLFTWYYIIAYIFFPSLLKLEIYEGLETSIYEFSSLLFIVGWLIIVLLIIILLIKFFIKKTNRIKRKRTIVTFILAIFYILLENIFRLIFAIFY